MNRRQKIIVSITGLFIVLLALVGLTYAYFLSRIIGNKNEKSISVTTAHLELLYEDGNGMLTASYIEPGDYITFTGEDEDGNEFETQEKTFSVENTGNVAISYGIYLEEVLNEFKRYDDIVLTISCTSTTNGNTCEGYNGTFPRIDALVTTNKVEVGEKHNYTLKVQYKEMNVDQSIDMNKRLSAKVELYELNKTLDNENSLAYNILNNVLNNSFSVTETNGYTPTVFRSVPITLPGQAATTKQQETIGTEKTFVPNGDLYYVYAESYEFNEYSGYTLVNPQIDKYSDIISNPSKFAKFKYARDYDGSNSIGERTENIKDTNKILSATANEIKYQELTLTPLEGSVEKTLTAAIDDYGISYYFRGDVEDNFLSYNGMCWRIVRIQGDGSVKLLLESYTSECNSNMELYDKLGKVYYGSKVETGVYSADYLNAPKETEAQQESMRNVLNQWLTDGSYKYEHNAFDTTELKKGDWCLGNLTDPYNSEYPYNKLESTTVTTLKSSFNKFMYDSYQRIYRTFPEYTTLKCGNGLRVVDDYVGALTADEFINAGEKIGFKTLSGNYLKKRPDDIFFSLTPMDFTGKEDTIFLVRQDSSSKRSVTTLSQIRPAIVLNNKVLFKSGTGTIDDAYEIN